MILMFSLMILILALFLLMTATFISFKINLISILSFNIQVSLMVDWISMMFLSIVMFISSMILMFSMSYIPMKEHKQFALLLISFVLSMSLLILSDNILFILLGWDGLGLTSYILVIFYQNASAASSGSITIFSNRVGDVMILLSISILMTSSTWDFSMNKSFPLITLILLILAACSKSAQFPFSAWLPAAMAAPTPISALVHSSTLVTAGVFMMIRIMNSPHPNSMMMILVISTMTVIYASLSANWEMDMKKVIALSTLSQIAMMMFAIAITAIPMAFFHLIIHALFKSLMFLCAGIMIHSFSYQDTRHMGTIMLNYPTTMTIMGITSMALMGIPFMSGFFSKDPIIEWLIFSKPLSIMMILMIMSVGMTASYSLRMIKLSMSFYMKSNPDTKIHPNNNMELPILIMTPLSIFSGTMISWLLIPEQLLIISAQYKFFILLMLLSGAMMGILLNYISKNYKKLGFSSLSLWHLHTLTASLTTLFNPMMNILSLNDKKWQESYGPSTSYNQQMNLSPFPDKLLTSTMFSIMILMFIPILIFMF